MGFLAEELRHFLDHAGHAGHAADQNHLVDVAGRQACIFQRGLTGLHRLLDQVVHKAFQLGAGQLHHHVQRRARVAVHRDERLVDLGLAGGRQLDLGLFSGFLQALKRHLVLGQIDAMLFLELVSQVVDDAHVEVFATEEGVAVGRFHLEQTVIDFEDGDVEGATAKVIDGDGLGVFLVKPIGQRGGGRLVDDAQNLKPCDLARVLGGLALRVVEVGGHRDHGLRHRLAQIGLGGFLHLLQDHGRDLRRRILLAAHFDPCVAIARVHDGIGDKLLVLFHLGIAHAATDQAFDGKYGIGRVGDSLTLGGLPNQTFSVGKAHDRGRGACTFGVFDHTGLRSIHDGNAGVGRPEVDPDDFGHDSTSSSGDVMEADPQEASVPDPN